MRWINIEAEDAGCHPRAMHPPGNEASLPDRGFSFCAADTSKYRQSIGAADDELKRVLGLRVSPLLVEIMYSDLSVSPCTLKRDGPVALAPGLFSLVSRV